MSHRNDLLRLFNQDSAGSYYSVSPDGRTGLAQILRYAARTRGSAVTLGLTDKYRSAKYFGIEDVCLETDHSSGVTNRHGIPLPDFGVYAAVELGK